MAKTILEEKVVYKLGERKKMGDELNAELLGFFQKSQEANLLAWGAIAETLDGLNSRLSKADEEDEEAKKAKEEEEVKKAYADERTALVKDIAGEVIGMLKGMMGLDVDATKEKRVNGADLKLPAGAKWPMGVRVAQEDVETPVKIDTDIKTQQQPIQAMQKHDATAILNDHMAASVHPQVEEDVDEEKPVEDMKDENESAEYPMEEDEAKESPVSAATVKMLSKQLADLKKMLDEQKATNDKEVDFRVKKKLTEFGFKQEKPSGVHRSALGVDETPIVKAATKDEEDPIEALSKLSYVEINRLRFAQDAGVGEVPKV